MKKYENYDEFMSELDKEIANGNKLASLLKFDFLLLEREEERGLNK